MSAAPQLDFMADDLAAFRQAKSEGKLLNRTPDELLVKKVIDHFGVDEDKARDAVRLSRHYATFTTKDKGVIAELVAEYVRFRDEELGVQGTNRLVRGGLHLWLELATIIGNVHRNGDSIGITRRLVMGRRTLLDEAVNTYSERLSDEYLLMLNQQLEEEARRLDSLMQETLSTERELLARAADQAQQDATNARRALETMQAEARRAQQTAQAEIQKLQAQLESERLALIARERTWNEERRLLEADKKTAQALAADLNRQLDERTTFDPAPTPPAPTTVTLNGPVEALAYRAYLQGQAVTNVIVKGSTVSCATGLQPAWLHAFQTAYPTVQAQMTLLKGKNA